ncbi:hypothetical protein [Thiolapillus sp.]
MTAVADKRHDSPDTVVFWLMRDLAYGRRMLLAFGLIVLGFGLQWYTGEIFSGVIPLIAGNALLLVKGYDNRVEFGSFNPSRQWQTVPRERLAELEDFDRKIRQWDRSFLDISNIRGKASLAALILVLFGLLQWIQANPGYSRLMIIPVDIVILFVPHWFTGTRRILRLPGLLIKAETLEQVLKDVTPEEKGFQVEILMLLKGESRLPEDIKLKLMPENAPENFLGLYGQVVINNVQGKSYPYFYVVLVGRPGLGLSDIRQKMNPPGEILVEYKEQDGVEVLVIRQFTTRKSGYHTSKDRVDQLLRLGLEQAESLVRRG